MNTTKGYIRGNRAAVEGVVEELRRYAAEHGGTCETAGGTTSRRDGTVSTYITVTLPDEPDGEADADG